MFGIGGFELFIILVFGFLIFGPEKLPEIARTVGKGIARFREAQADMNETLGNDKIFDPNNPDEPFKDPIEALDKLAARQEEKRRAKESGGKEEKAVSTTSPKASTSAGSAASSDMTTSSAEKAAGATSAAVASPASAGESEKPRQESFTERKARYERERAARKAAEAEAASRPAQGGDE